MFRSATLCLSAVVGLGGQECRYICGRGAQTTYLISNVRERLQGKNLFRGAEKKVSKDEKLISELLKESEKNKNDGTIF